MLRLLCCLLLLAVTASALAHFPFIVPDEGGASARLLMSESLYPDSEVGIEILAGTKLVVRGSDGRDTPLTLEKGEHWMSMALPGSGTRVVHGVSDLGVMKRGKPHLLIYHPKTIIGDPFDAATTLGDRAPVELVPVRIDGGFRLRLLIGGKPAAEGMEVRILTPDNEEENLTTDAEGLTPEFVAPGRYGAWARHWLDEPGERDGTAYEQVRRYATIVLDFEGTPGAAEALAAPAHRVAVASAPLPEPVASFGAVACGDWLYVYGGHIAERHEYSTASVSGRFHRRRLDAPGTWEVLPEGVPVQGMNLAAHGGKVYRVGGMQPRNSPDEGEDRYSIADAAAFDPGTGEWKEIPPLPRPRSSHEVAVVGDTLLAIGGWWMKGAGEESGWPGTMETLDLSSERAAWESVSQPFERRALTAAVLGSQVFVMGGMDAQDALQLRVDVYDAKARTWSRGPSIPGGERNGFSPAACAHGGAVYLSVASGAMYRLSPDQKKWEPFARGTPRIVHRLVPREGEILLLGGASGNRMLDLVEVVGVR